MTALAYLHTECAEDTADRVRRELFLDPRVELENLNVEIHQDLDVTLSGTATTYASKLYAEGDVRQMYGIRDVHNHIKVVVPPQNFRSDMEIADAVRHTFRWNSILPPKSVNCVVADGWVLITGNVSAEYQKEEAETAVTHIWGVKGIVNDVKVVM